MKLQLNSSTETNFDAFSNKLSIFKKQKRFLSLISSKPMMNSSMLRLFGVLMMIIFFFTSINASNDSKCTEHISSSFSTIYYSNECSFRPTHNTFVLPCEVTTINACISGGNVTFITADPLFGATPGTWTISGGGTIGLNTGVFTPSSEGCWTATYKNAAMTCSDTKHFVVFPTAPVLTPPSNTCNAAFILPTVASVSGFDVEYSIDDGMYSPSPSTTDPGCHNVKAHYILQSNCGMAPDIIPAGSFGSSPCLESDPVNVVIFPLAPPAPMVNSGCGDIMVTPPMSVSGFDIKYSFDDGMTWGDNFPPTGDNCLGYKIKTRYVLSSDCLPTMGGAVSTDPVCAESPATTRIVDKTAPTITSCAVTLTIEGCNTDAITDPAYSATSAASSEAQFEDGTNQGNASDACGITSVTYIDVITSSPCPTIVTRTWTITDACGHSSSCNQTITVHDTGKPVANQLPNEGNVTLECDDVTGLTTALAFAPSFTDNCDPSVSAALQSTVNTKDADVEVCGHYNYTITRTWTGTDACGNTSLVYTQVITVNDTKKPVADQSPNSGNVTIQCDDATGMTTALAYAPTFTDNCDPTAPTVFKSSVSTQDPDAEVCGHYNYTITRTWTGTDACGNTSLVYTQVITINDTKKPVADQSPNSGNVTIQCDDASGMTAALAFAPTFTDNCDPTAPTVFKSSASTQDPDVEVCGHYNYTITRTWTGTDACGNTSLVYTQVITVNDTKKPVADQSPNSGNVTIQCDDATGMTAALAYAPTFTDNCDPTAPTVFQSSVSTQDPDAEVCGHYNYTITRTWTGTDACGNTSLVYTQVITVNDTKKPVADQSPNSGNVTIQCDDATGMTTALAYAPTFTDNCDPTAPTVLQSSVNTQDPDAEVCGHYNYTITRTWTGTDACGNTSLVYTQVITVNDTKKPVADQSPNSGNVTIQCDDATGMTAALAFAPTFTDNCDPTAPASLQSTVNTQNSDASVCGHYNYTITRTWTGTDACGNTSLIYTQIITVMDNTAPTFTGSLSGISGNGCVPTDVPAATTIGALEALAGNLAVSDNCTPHSSLVVTSSDASTGTCPVVVTRTYKVADACGNLSADILQTITINAPPVVLNCPMSTNTASCQTQSVIDGLFAAWLGSFSFTGGCGGSFSTNPVTPTAPPRTGGTSTVTWTVTGSCPGSQQCTRSYTVDNAPIHDMTSDKYFCTLADAMADGGTQDGDVWQIQAGTYPDCVTISMNIMITAVGGPVTLGCVIMDGMGKELDLGSDLTITTLTLTHGKIHTKGHHLACSTISGGTAANYIVTD